MVIRVSEALDSDTSSIINVERRNGSYVNGLYVKGVSKKFKTLASVQQPTPKQLLILKEGERSKTSLLFISKKPLQCSDDKQDLLSDLVTFKGLKYKIMAIADWDIYGHTMAIGVIS